MNQLKENKFNRENDDTSRLGMTKCHEERNVRRHLGKSRSVLRIGAVAEVSFSIQPRVQHDNINNKENEGGLEQADTVITRPYRRPPSGWGPRRPTRGRPADGSGSARPARIRAGAPPPRPRPRGPEAGSCSSRRQCRCRGRTCSDAASKFNKSLFISTSLTAE